MTPTEKPPTWHEIQETRKALREATAAMVFTPIPRWSRFVWRLRKLVRRG